MTVLALSADSFMLKWVAAPFFVICCLALILIILIQKGRGGGLSAAFGGGGGGGLLGSKTGDFLTWVTIGLVAMVLTLAVFLAKYYKPAFESPPGFESPPALQQSLPEDPVPPVGIEDTASNANTDSSGT